MKGLEGIEERLGRGSPAAQIPQGLRHLDWSLDRAGDGDGGLLSGAGGVGEAVRRQIVRAEPHAVAELGVAQCGHGLAQLQPLAGRPGIGGDHQRPPGAVPVQGRSQT